MTVRTTLRTLGLLAAAVRVGPDFDAPLPADLTAAFAGETP